MPLTIKTDIIIDAPPSVVRKVFFDFPAYPEWNPWFLWFETPDPTLAPGTRVKTITDGHIIRPVIKTCTNDELKWVGALGAVWLFAGNHDFEWQPHGDMGENGETKSCKFVQNERFSGLIAWPLFMYVGKTVEKGFNDMNAALKVRAEAAVNAG
jgi:hypothetical protein